MSIESISTELPYLRAHTHHSHRINLQSDFSNFYWDRPDLEQLYNQALNHMEIANRKRTTNDRLQYCNDLVELVRTTLE